MKMKNVNEIYLRDLRVILKYLKLGLLNDQIDAIISSFPNETVSYQEF